MKRLQKLKWMNNLTGSVEQEVEKRVESMEEGVNVMVLWKVDFNKEDKGPGSWILNRHFNGIKLLNGEF